MRHAGFTGGKFHDLRRHAQTRRSAQCRVFFARGKAIIGGIGWELAQECAVLTDTPIPPPDYHSPNRPGFLMHVEGDMFALLAEEKFLLAGGTLAYGSFPVRTEFCGHEWYLQIAGKGIMR